MEKEKRIFTWTLIAALIILLALSCKKDDGPVQPAPDPIGQPDPEPDPENRPPEPFGLLTFEEGAENVDVLPTLSWEQATDLDGDQVVYDLYLDMTDEPSQLISENLGTTSYTLQDKLEYESDYQWKVVAKDDKGAETESASRSFETREIAIEWQVSLGGSGIDNPIAMQGTKDGGFVVAGYSESMDGDVGSNKGDNDFWITRLGPDGNLIWARQLGGSKSDVANAIQQTQDGGFVVVGYSLSADHDVSKNQGNSDYWIVKLDANGLLKWETSFGGSGFDSATAVHSGPNGELLVVGASNSNDGDVSSPKGDMDVWVLKLNDSGNLISETSYGGTGMDFPNDVLQTSDGNFVITAISQSADGDVSENKGGSDYWILKISSNGNIIWQHSYGGAESENVMSAEQTSDGGLIIAGISYSQDGDISNPKGEGDYWVLKLDAEGTLQWETSLGGSQEDSGNSIAELSDSGFIVAGYTNSSDIDVSQNSGNGSSDYWVVKLDDIGNIKWEVNLGGTKSDEAKSIVALEHSGVVVSGYSSSSDGDVIGNHGAVDYWIVKLN